MKFTKYAILVCPYCEHEWIMKFNIITSAINLGNRSTVCSKCHKRCFVDLFRADTLTPKEIERMGLEKRKKQKI